MEGVAPRKATRTPRSLAADRMVESSWARTWGGGWVGGRVGGWVGDRKVEEIEAVRMRCCELGVWVGGFTCSTCRKKGISQA